MKLISISLWGARELYLQGAIANAHLLPAVYPGWTMRAYCGSEVPILDVLRSLGVDVRVVPESPGYAGLFWRFLPAGEADVEHVIVRDADSRLNVREKAAVDAWIASGHPFHVMRDHFHHRDVPMLAGMWGCRGGSIPDIADRIARFSQGAVKHEDTKFLRNEIWPLIRERCLVHSSVPEPLGGDPFPAHPQYDGFVGEIVDERAEARDVVAVLLPSRGRPEAALAAARSAHATASAAERLCIAVGVEPDEADTYRRTFGDHASWIRALRSGGNYVRAIRELHRSTPAGIYGFCADDFRFETPGWDAEIRRAANDLPERLGLLYADDGLQGERLATAPFVTAEWVACVGNPLPGDYTHLFCDTEITEIARAAGLLRFLPAVKISHRHYLAGEAVFDETYERSAATSASGRTEFERRAEERQRLAERLEEASRPPRLSLLVSGLVQHADRLDAQLATLHRQRMALPDACSVEVLVEPDAGERSMADKRKSLLARARGRWVAFLDDEEVVADDALAQVLRALERGADAITVARPAGFGLQTSNRVVALRRTVALAVSARDRAGREDFKWSGTLSRFLKSETTVAADVFRASSATSTRARPVSGALRGERDTRSPLAPAGLPSAAHQLLLTAAVAGEERALGAWRKWVVEVGPSAADDAARRLFPLAWWNLQRLGAGGIELNALKAFYWRSWATSMDLSRRAAEVARAFESAGVRALLVHGFAVAVRHHAQPALRPTGAVALLIPRSQATQARVLVEAAGWRATSAPAEGGARRRTLLLRDRAGHHLALHSDFSLDNGRAATGDGWWERSESVDVDGAAMRVPSPADQLVDVCVRGFRWSTAPRVQWAADVVAIVASAANRIDEDGVVAAARARRALLRTRRALRWVRDAFEIRALDPVCRRLDATRCGLADRLDARLRLRPPSTGRNLLARWLDERPGA